MKLKEYPLSFLKSLQIRYFLHKYRNDQRSLAENAGASIADCIVSLTSIPDRISSLHLTIGSLLMQNMRPKKIVLWLNSDLEKSLPAKLTRLTGPEFEVRFRSGASSHRKLVFALQEFPNELIITCDDDVMYSQGWLDKLLDDHSRDPGLVVCHEAREVSATLDGELATYSKWKTVSLSGTTSDALVPIDYAGRLYPPGCLFDDATNKAAYLALALKADDLWFKAMALLKGTTTRKCSTPCKKPTPIIGTKHNSLAKMNINQDLNRKQWLDICAHYQLNP